VETAPAGSLLACLRQIPDPRGAHGRRHSCSAMLATVVCAVLCGARGYEAIAEWIHAQLREIWYLLGYFRRPPTAGAFRYLLMKLDPDVLEAALREWIAQHVDTSSVDLPALAIDGKMLCGTLAEHGRSVALLSLFDQTTGCVLSQMEVPADTNEAKAALPILKTLTLEGRVVTGDAMFAQPEICREIVDSGGDYLLVVKDNQHELKATIAGDFLPGFSPRYRAQTPVAAL
jgi:DDE_Tnp_1-associated/Transposase DDE domain